jgi:cyanophycinase-like exopeptidase
VLCRCDGDRRADDGLPDPAPAPALVALQAPKGSVVLGIDEDTAVVGRNGAWQVHGVGRVTVWHGRHRERFRKGEAFQA